MAEQSITFVTAFFDIDRVTDDPMTKYENYFGLIQKLLTIPVNIYFITTPAIHDKLQYEKRSSLKFHLVDSVPFFDNLPIIETCWNNYQTSNKRKDTAKFACFTHAKFHFVQQAITANPFNSTHYAWMDAGILKIATNPERLIQLRAPDKIKLLMLYYINNSETRTYNFVLTCRYKIAGGFFVGPRELMSKFYEEVKLEAEASIKQNIFGLEQEYMAIVYRKHPELFEPYYGGFCDLFTNYDTCCNSFGLVTNFLKQAIEDNDFIEARKVAKYLLASPNYTGNRQALLALL